MTRNFLGLVIDFIRGLLEKVVKFFLSIFGVSSETDLLSDEIKKSFVLLSISLFVFFVFFVVFLAIFLVPSPTVKVPNLLGDDILDAIAKLENARLIPSVEFVISQDKPRGEVLRQIPYPGNIVREGKTVKMFVSIGSGEFILPDFVGKPLEEVRSFLSSRGVYISSIEYVKSEYGRGLVVRTLPSAGTKLKPGMPITVFVSTGVEDSIPMPNLIGFNYENAAIFLSSKNVKFKMVPVPVNDPGSDGIVLDHIPKEGEFISKDSFAEIMVGVFGDENVSQNTRFILYYKNLSAFSKEGVSNYYLSFEIEDQIGVRKIKKKFNNLSSVVIPLRLRGIGKLKVYVNDELVLEETL